MLALLVAVLWLAAPAAAEVDPAIVGGLRYLRDAPDGGAMWAYIKRDPLPIRFERLHGPPGRYVGGRRGRAWILLDEALRSGAAEEIGRSIYHEYIHRLQDLSPEWILANETHSRFAYDAAMRHLRDAVRPGGPVPRAPPEVEAEFLGGPRPARERGRSLGSGR